MQLLISDANILIDMEEGQLLRQVFGLPFEFRVPDLLFFDELEEQHAHWLEYGLKLGTLTGDSVKVEQLVIQGLMTADDARTSYQRMKDNGRRLPWDAALQRLKDLQEKI